MSADEIQAIIRRSVIDRAFAKALRENFYEAVREYHLNESEIAALRSMEIEIQESRGNRRRDRAIKHRRPERTHGLYRLD